MAEVLEKCPVCGAILDEEDLFCANCGTAAPQNKDQQKPPVAHEVTCNFVCKGCGASMSYDARAGRCAARSAARPSWPSSPTRRKSLRKASCRLSFQQADAIATMRKWLGSSFWRPGDLSEQALVVSMTPVYVPYWVFQAETHTYWTADSSHTPPGARASWYPVSGQHEGQCDGLLVGASSVLTAAETSAICPFDLAPALPPEKVDLVNATFERFTVPRKYARPVANQGFEEIEREACRQYVPGKARNLHVNVRVTDLTSRPMLLPVWIMAYRYQDRVFRFLANGQSGRCDRAGPDLVAKDRGGGGDRGDRCAAAADASWLTPRRPPGDSALRRALTQIVQRANRKRASPRRLMARLACGFARLQSRQTQLPRNAILPVVNARSLRVRTLREEPRYCAKRFCKPPPQPPPEPQPMLCLPEEDRELRPQRMRDMVGQREVYARLEIAVDAAQKRGETLGHILFDGPPGLGKTTFATCIPRDLGVSFQIASGAALAAPKDLIPYLTNAEERSVLFIDEIHRLPKPVEEFLYPAMEDFRIDILLGEGVNARHDQHAAAAVHADRRDDAGRHDLGPAARSVPSARASRFLHASPSWPRSFAAAPRNCRCRSTRPAPRKSPAAAAARRGWPTTACAGSAIMSPAKPTAESISNWPGRRWPCRGSTSWGSTARTANIWKRSSACFTAGRWASKRLPTR